MSRASPIIRHAIVPNDDASLVPPFGVFCLLLFCFVVLSRKLELGEVAVIGAVLAVLIGRFRIRLPPLYGYYLGYLLIGALGLLTTQYPTVVSSELYESVKVAVIAVATASLLSTQRAARTLVLGYLLLFALFPVRGALFNFVNGITEKGRIAWNFFFSNPNDLAITCLLPIGLCAYVLFVEKSVWLRRTAWVGIFLLVGIILLTQSRGAIVGLGVGAGYLIVKSKNRARVLVALAVLLLGVGLVVPQSSWERLVGLSQIASGNMASVDPEGSAQGRARLMTRAIKFAVQNPVLGVGLGAFAFENARVTVNDPNSDLERGFRDAHSAFARAAAETGIIGGILVIVFVIGAIRYVHVCRRRVAAASDNHSYASALLMLELSMVAYTVAAIFNSGERSTFFALQYVLPCALASLMQEQIKVPVEPKAIGAARRTGQRPI